MQCFPSHLEQCLVICLPGASQLRCLVQCLAQRANKWGSEVIISTQEGKVSGGTGGWWMCSIGEVKVL